MIQRQPRSRNHQEEDWDLMKCNNKISTQVEVDTGSDSLARVCGVSQTSLDNLLLIYAE